MRKLLIPALVAIGLLVPTAAANADPVNSAPHSINVANGLSVGGVLNGLDAHGLLGVVHIL